MGIEINHAALADMTGACACDICAGYMRSTNRQVYGKEPRLWFHQLFGH